MKDILESLDGMSPVLVMGDAVSDFKMGNKYPINRVGDAKSIRELVEKYSVIEALDYPLIVEDLSFISDIGASLLLKIVEAAKIQMIFLALYDKVPTILLSRMRRVIKYKKEKTMSNFISAGKALNSIYLEREDEHFYELCKRMARYSPEAYYYDRLVKNVKQKEKLIQILTSKEI